MLLRSLWVLITGMALMAPARLVGQADSAEFASYRAHVYAAQAAIRLQSATQAHAWLSGAPMAQRGWEWAYLVAVGAPWQRQLTVPYADTAAITALCSAGGSVLWVGHQDGSLTRIAEDGPESGSTTYRGQGALVTTVAPHPLADSLVVGYANGEIWVRATANPALGRLLGKHNQRVFDLAVHPKGTEVTSVGWDRTRNPFRLWGEWHRWSLTTSVHRAVEDTIGHPVSTVTYSPDGANVAIGCWQHAIRWLDAVSGTERWRYEILPNEPEIDYAALQDVAISPTGTLLAAVGKDKRLRVLDPATGRCLRVIARHTQWANAVVWVDSVRLVSAGADGMAYLWDARTGKLEASYFGHEGPIEALVALPGGRFAVAGSRSSRLTVYGLAELPNPWQASHSKKGAWHTGFSPDGRYAALCSSDPVVTVLATDGEPRQLGQYRGHTADVVGFDFHPTEPWVASVGDDGWCRIWDCTRFVTLDSLPVASGRYNMVRWAASGTQLVAVGPDIRVFGRAEGRWAETRRLAQAQESFYDLVVGPDVGWLLLAGRTGRLYSWQPGADTLTPKAWRHTGVANRLAWHPGKGIAASTGQDGLIALWQPTAATPLAVLSGHENYTAGLAFSPSGDRLASCSYDYTLRMWDWQRGAEVLRIDDFADEPYTLAFNPRTAHLLVGIVTGDYRLYRPHTQPE
ncbi:MAG: WD40 repeat domain-containing protein [Bacteroidia bacterium]|nr:WD40 repeat domain-containing protein [Bacteroidia bacterium]